MGVMYCDTCQKQIDVKREPEHFFNPENGDPWLCFEDLSKWESAELLAALDEDLIQPEDLTKKQFNEVSEYERNFNSTLT